MKYSYSSTTGFQTTPSPQTQHVHRPSLSQPPPPPPRPASHYTRSPPQSPPASGNPYASFPGSQPQSPYSPHSPGYGQQPRSPPPPPPRPAHTRNQSTGYTPVNYDTPHASGFTPEQFYGSLIDTNNRPTEVFSRLADAFFFWIDQNCDIPGLRGTGVIEPAKYAWMSSKMGAAPDACQIVQQFLPSFYDMASIPHRYVQTQNGQVPIVDRRGWLHLSVFEARASPEESHQHWNKALALFTLIDPMTNTPFPSPVPRAALPAYADPTLSSLYSSWRTQAIIGASRERSNAMVQSILNNRPSYNPYQFMAAAAGGGLGANAYTSALGGSSGGGGGGSGGSSGGNGNHATVMDTVNTIGTLANTILGGLGASTGTTGFNFGS
ncbi:hypothetical protein PHLGIDRAFT_36580 [Phlebiopsis gigantea 11061_1 CR5-6]|uniref:DUF7514 domain-containing protein n=1 Tax=Phlebiopsis gigantea (strain 11061_1 CR5-6) TaxID=745531 RepID=A0A0C3S871_PHLG1|nr:hypothetical protein PHLGIDRAFT_36580 [Phlebiopsis gigantea 11061_1 CR5-6]